MQSKEITIATFYLLKPFLIGADTASIRIMQHIHEHCQKVMLLLNTRPIKDYNVTFIDDYKATGSYQEIELSGLGEFEIGDIILQNFDSGVNRISPEIVKVVQVSFATSKPLMLECLMFFILFYFRIETNWW